MKLLITKYGWGLLVIIAGACLCAVIWRLRLNAKVNKAAVNDNIKAFLTMLRNCEGTAGSDGYNTTYGYSRFTDMTDHPAITGEWTGAQLTDAQCRGAGLNPPCKSTAAGAYQFTKPTWQGIKLSLQLPDFTPASQDLAAIEKIRQCGALDDILAGNIQTAIAKCRGTWASLPGATTGQPTRSLTAAIGYYQDAGGALTA